MFSDHLLTNCTPSHGYNYTKQGKGKSAGRKWKKINDGKYLWV